MLYNQHQIDLNERKFCLTKNTLSRSDEESTKNTLLSIFNNVKMLNYISNALNQAFFTITSVFQRNQVSFQNEDIKYKSTVSQLKENELKGKLKSFF